jgi:hypothetical protein
MTVPFFVCVRSFGEPFDRAQPPIPLLGQLSRSPSRLVKAIGF